MLAEFTYIIRWEEIIRGPELVVLFAGLMLLVLRPFGRKGKHSD